MRPDLLRVHFTGAAGSGTTTLGRAVAERAGLMHFETDDYLWEATDPPYQQLRSEGERVRRLRADLANAAGWVLSGALTGWGDPFIEQFHLVVLVLVPTEIRLARLRARELERFGAEALAPGGAMHAHHAEFLEWAARYDTGDESTRSRRLHDTWLSSLPCPTLQVDGTRSVDALVDDILLRLRHRASEADLAGPRKRGA